MKQPAPFRLQMLLVLFLAQLFCGTAFSAPLQIAVEDDAGPWSQREGTGFANDVVRAAFKAAGVEVELTVVPYARCKDMVFKGKVAACFSMSWLPEFTGKVVFADKPLFSCYSDYFTGSRKPLKATQESDLPRGTVVGIVSGYEYPPSVYALKEKGIVVFEESESEVLNLKKLALGRIDAALVNYNKTKPAELLLKKAGVSDKVKRAFRSGTLGSFIGFSTKHPQGMEALKEFNRGYRIISSNGTRDKAERKWLDSALKELAGLSVNSPKK
ncbi:MAG TPA: transporter substrate-binding domain-containing protein [Dongiaceae bacterium]|nr:transporter substrate-binding domain-containing protein [Dongiaceae bacterium]